jgi:hypothetical protein
LEKRLELPNPNKFVFHRLDCLQTDPLEEENHLCLVDGHQPSPSANVNQSIHLLLHKEINMYCFYLN